MLLTLGAYSWMIASFINMLIMYWLFTYTQKAYHIMYIIVWACCGLWGVTSIVDFTPVVHIINTAILPMIGGISGTIGAILKLNELMNTNQIKIEKNK